MDRKSQQFKDLKNQWYKKLKDSGFEDIEEPDLEYGNLRLSNPTVRRDDTKDYATKVYYDLADKFLNEYIFPNFNDKAIWESHSSGKSIRAIYRSKDKLGIDAGKNKIEGIIKKYRGIMLNKYGVTS